MKMSTCIIVPPLLPIPVLALTNKTSITLVIRKGKIGDHCLTDESIYLSKNRNTLDDLLQGKSIVL